MTDKDNGGSAFPGPSFTKSGHPSGHDMGMTLRDWVAGQCMAHAFGSLSETPLDKENGETVEAAMFRTWMTVAKSALIAADAFIAARSK